MKPFFEIYTRSYPPCRYCRDLKDLLNIYGYDFYEMDIMDPAHKKDFDEAGLRTVPQVYIEIDEQYRWVGGYDNTRDYLRREFLKDHPNKDAMIKELEELGA